jgi:hypothetical protein
MVHTSVKRQVPNLPTQTGSAFGALILCLVLLISVIAIFRLVQSHVSADIPRISSGLDSYCLNVYDGKTDTNTSVDTWKCNDTASQDWVATIDTITHDGSQCLSVQGDAVGQGSKVVINPCNAVAGQIWLRDQAGYQNPNSGLCLTASSSRPTDQLFISDCSNLASSQETWTPTLPATKNNLTNLPCTGTEGQKVACYAIKGWTTWQSGSISHESLLNSYTDGAPYEEWCADFVSYVYKEAGYPFIQGDTDGWDENVADNIQYMGFLMHPADSNYVPQAGDIAFFNYSDGHVEIVVSGGKTPTFIYGDSAVIDPTTGNGQMVANTITQKADEGQLVYYLSPD